MYYQLAIILKRILKGRNSWHLQEEEKATVAKEFLYKAYSLAMSWDDRKTDFYVKRIMENYGLSAYLGDLG